MESRPEMRGNTGSNLLVRTLIDLIREYAPNQLGWNSTGTILEDMSLQVDNFGDAFPPGLYLVAERFLYDDPILTSNETIPESHQSHTHNSPNVGVGDHGDHNHGSHDHGAHDHGAHTHTLPRKGIFRRLQPNDRVQVSWINKSMPVVVDRINFVTAIVDSERLV